MKVGLDARSMTMPRPRGTARNLLDAYRLIADLRPDWEFVLYHQRPLDPAANDERQPWHRPNVTLRQLDMPGDRFDAWFQVRLPLAARQDQLDLLHMPANRAPAWCPTPFVATVHDLIPVKLPGELSPAETRAFRHGVVRAVRHSVHIVTPSQATRDELHAGFDVPLEKMTVIPWAPDQHIMAEASDELSDNQRRRLRQEYGLAERWLVTFSGSGRRKNARGVLDGLARVSPEVRRGVQVVLIGCEPESYRQSLAVDAERLGIADQCRILSFVPHRDLPGLLRGSVGLLMPSRAEGFGLPILDAFTCGVPVLTSNVSSMPEVAGDAAAYCDPNDGGSIAEGIAHILVPQQAAELVRRGRARLNQFSWQRTAEAMCAVYEQSAALPRRFRPMLRMRREPVLAGSSEGDA